MRLRYLLLPLILLLFTSTESVALDGVSLGIGRSRDDIDIYHLGFQKQFGGNLLEWKTGYLSGYHEGSMNHWRYKEESVQQVAYSPVFVCGFDDFGSGIFPYLEGGIGVSFISEKEIKDRDMSSYFQFEDRIGVGVKIGKERRHNLNFKYLHYSNADIKQPNEGIDIFMLSYAFSIDI
jgi:lipid A 3-O-deacylase